MCKIKEDRMDYAYARGHGTTGYLEGLVLTLIVPEKREAILGRADDYAPMTALLSDHVQNDVGIYRESRQGIL